MFTLREREEPLSQLLGGLGQVGLAYAGNRMRESREQKQRESLSNALEELDMMQQEGREVSPLTVLKKITSVNAPETMKKQALDTYESMNRKRKMPETSLNPEQQAFVNTYLGPTLGGMWAQMNPGERLEFIRQGRETMERYGVSLEDYINKKNKKGISELEGLAEEDNQPASFEQQIEQSYEKLKQKHGDTPILERPVDIDFSVLPKDVEFDQETATKGLTGKETANIWVKHNLQKNEEAFKDSTKNLRAAESQLGNLRELKRINDSGNLPSGLQKALFVGPDGKLRAVSKLTGLGFTQKELKDIDQWEKFLASASLENLTGTFGGRVTDFDIKAQREKFPSLFNTQEGRRILINHMMLAQRANMLYDNALREVIARYGAGRISPSNAQILAEKLIAPQIKEIQEEAQMVAERSKENEEMSKTSQLEKSSPGISVGAPTKQNVFDRLPDPKKFPGRTFVDTVTGKKFVSNGKTFEEKK